MVVSTYSGGREVISERRLIIMGIVSSYQPWKEENQAMRDEWEVGSIWKLLSWGKEVRVS